MIDVESDNERVPAVCELPTHISSIIIVLRYSVFGVGVVAPVYLFDHCGSSPAVPIFWAAG